MTLAEAFRSDGPTSSTSTSYTVRFSPSLVSYERCRSRPDTITRIPRVRLSATFSAACRHTLQVRNRLSPSLHSFVLLSRNLGVDATRNFATGCPAGVNRNSGIIHEVARDRDLGIACCHLMLSVPGSSVSVLSSPAPLTFLAAPGPR